MGRGALGALSGRGPAGARRVHHPLCAAGAALQLAARRSVAEVLNPRYLAAYAAGSLVAFGAGVAMGGNSRGRPLDAAAMAEYGYVVRQFGVSSACRWCSRSSAPISRVVALALMMMVENFTMIPLCAWRSPTAQPPPRPVLKAMLRAIAIRGAARSCCAIFVGFAFAFRRCACRFRWARRGFLPGVGRGGAVLCRRHAGGLRVGALLGPSVAIALGKLVLHPLAVLVALRLAGPIAPPLQASAVLLACAPMLGIYPLPGRSMAARARTRRRCS